MRRRLLVLKSKNMTGLFHKKYNIAVYGENQLFVKRIATTLKAWFQNKAVVHSYTDSHQMFLDLNIAKAKNCPFDMTVVESKTGVEASFVLKHVDPSMEVVSYKDVATLKKETAKLCLNKPSNGKLTLKRVL